MSSGDLPKQAMVLSAGLATRMRPLTDDRPKALLKVGHQTILDHCLDRLVGAGVEKVVINLHHHGDQIEEHLKSRSDVAFTFVREETLLETGGGIANAIPHFDDKAFIVMNAKMILLDGPTPTMQRLASAWREAEMDALLLLHSTVEAYGYRGVGDFLIDPLGNIMMYFPPDKVGKPLMEDLRHLLRISRIG